MRNILQMDNANDQLDNHTNREQIEAQAREIQRLQATVNHYRSWASQLQTRYQMFSPDAARPAKRVYIGNLAPDVTEADLREGINDLLCQAGGICSPGLPITSCKLYPGPQRTVLVNAGPSMDSSGLSDIEHNDSPLTDRGSSDIPSSATTPRPPSSADLHTHNHASSSLHSQGASSQSNILLPLVVQDKSYAFVEFRSVEEAANCMALDGVRFRDNFLKVRRPNNYDPAVAIMLGPTDPNPGMDLAGLDVVRTVVADSPHKVFLGGLPCDWTEDQVKEMLIPYGTLKAFNLVMDRATGNSKGYAFCEFADITNTDAVIQSLNGKPVGNKYLTVKRALGGPVGF